MIPEWDRYFLDIARAVSARSKDPKTQVGALIVGPIHREIRATGYNGFPRGVKDTFPERWERPAKHNRVVHAEANCIISAARVGTPIFGCDLYTLLLPCIDCTKLICNGGIRRVIVDQTFMKQYVDSSWLTPEAREIIRSLFEESMIPVDFVA
jgi:dCMP deaminase